MPQPAHQNAYYRGDTGGAGGTREPLGGKIFHNAGTTSGG